MRQAALLVGGLVALLVAGCGGGVSNDIPETQMNVVLAQVTNYAGDPTTVTVLAQNDQVALRTLTIDFTDDGVWDDTRQFDSRAISEAFVHVYPDPGTYTVRADITDRIDRTVSQSIEVFVATPPPTVPVSYLVHGTSPEGGNCFAADRPVTCDGCELLVGTYTPMPETRSLGEIHRGKRVAVEQGFSQLLLITGLQTYSCHFYVQLIAGRPGSEQPFAAGNCQTSSKSDPIQLDCRAAVSGIVP